MRFIALDFETSGLDPKRHAPVTLGVAVFENGEVVASQEWLIAPPKDGKGNINREYDVSALEISGKTWKEIKNDGLSATMALSYLSTFVSEHGCQDVTVVAFNAPFDFAFYSEMIFMAGGWNQHERRFEQFVSPLAGPWQCARMLALHRLGESKLSRWNLDTVAGHFGFARETETHGAEMDAILAGRIYATLTGVGGKEQTERSDSENLVKTDPVQEAV